MGRYMWILSILSMPVSLYAVSVAAIAASAVLRGINVAAGCHHHISYDRRKVEHAMHLPSQYQFSCTFPRLVAAAAPPIEVHERWRRRPSRTWRRWSSRLEGPSAQRSSVHGWRHRSSRMEVPVLSSGVHGRRRRRHSWTRRR